MTSSPIDPSTSPQTADQSVAPSYCPSVPISLYRELAEELQATQAQLKVYQAQNQQLVQQNQQLRREATQILCSTRKIEQVIAAEKSVETERESRNLAAAEIREIRSAGDRVSGPVNAGPSDRWRLAVVFGAIALMAFAVGFVAAPSMMTLMNRHNR